MKRLLAVLFGLGFGAAVAAEDPRVAGGIDPQAFITAGNTTNVENTFPLTGAFTTNGTATVTVHHTAHGRAPGQAVSFQDTSAVIDGLNMDRAVSILTVPNVDSWTFTHPDGAASGSSAATGTTNVTYSVFGHDGKFRILCNMSHLAYADPIVSLGTSGFGHLHQFFGNTLTDHNSTYATLRATGSSTCDGGPVWRVGYWMPAMIDSLANKVVIPLPFQWYYVISRYDLIAELTSGQCPSGNITGDRPVACPTLGVKKIERGTRMIFGFRIADDGFPSTYVGDMLQTAYSCMDAGGAFVAGGYRYIYNPDDVGNSLYHVGLGTCPSPGRLQIRVHSPNCWNGNHDSPGNHYIHFAPSGLDGFDGLLKCPATHPRKFMGFEAISTYSYTNFSDLQFWFLSSDRHNLATYPAGKTFHLDLLWAIEDGAADGDTDDIQTQIHKWVHGMWPDPVAGPPYIYDAAGVNHVGGKGMRNVDSAGLGPDCTAVGASSTGCHLTARTEGIFDTLVDIPAPPGPGKIHFRRVKK